jgi:7-cyano-7-deazaguanine synthase in queuosine biosynthesis
MRKRVLIPWSGGMDSTYLIQLYSELGYDVYAGYIEVTNNLHKPAMEKRAIKKLRPLMDKYRFCYNGVMSTITVDRADGELGLGQPLLWLTPLAYQTRHYDEVAIGYVSGDCAVSYIDDMRAVWKAYSGFSQSTEFFPEITFPLIKLTKQEIWNKMDPEIRELCVYCEDPSDDEELGFVICGECTPCKRRKRDVQ